MIGSQRKRRINEYKRFSKETDSKKLRFDILWNYDKTRIEDKKTDKTGVTTYQTHMQLGITKKKWFLVGWRIDKPGDKPRLITAFRNDPK